MGVEGRLVRTGLRPSPLPSLPFLLSDGRDEAEVLAQEARTTLARTGVSNQIVALLRPEVLRALLVAPMSRPAAGPHVRQQVLLPCLEALGVHPTALSTRLVRTFDPHNVLRLISSFRRIGRLSVELARATRNAARLLLRQCRSFGEPD